MTSIEDTRRAVTDALYAIHTTDGMILINEELAQNLDQAWNAYDLALAGSALSVEHAIQAQTLERLGLTWTPVEPFVALVEDEINRLRTELHRVAEGRRGQRERADRLQASLSEILESFTEPGDNNDILRRARAALQ